MPSGSRGVRLHGGKSILGGKIRDIIIIWEQTLYFSLPLHLGPFPISELDCQYAVQDASE